MGKIIFSNIHPDFLEKISKFCAERNIPSTTFEALSAGMNHAEIGALIAERWNFPDRLVSTIRYHHDPGEVQEDYKDMIDAVYIANMLCEYEDRAVTFEQFETSSLENFGLNNKKQVDNLLDKLSAGFKKESQG